MLADRIGSRPILMIHKLDVSCITCATICAIVGALGITPPWLEPIAIASDIGAGSIAGWHYLRHRLAR